MASNRAKTNIRTVFSLDRKVVDVIEIGKDLFNTDSVVLLPALLDDEGGATDSDANVKALEKREGIFPLAAAYKQYEHDARKKLVIAGHVNDNDSVADSFDISVKRAEGVYHLLKGERDKWADIAYEKHSHKDVKRILVYFNLRRNNWDCDPENFSDDWTDDTTAALRNFCDKYTEEHPGSPALVHLYDVIGAEERITVSTSVWKAVFDLYLEEICHILKIRPVAPSVVPDTQRLPRNNVSFAWRGKRFVGCGKSYPLDDDDSKFKTEKDSRVELIFFNDKESPETHHLKNCSVHGDDVHVAAQCPIWRRNFLLANYIDPVEDLKVVAYHLQFDYYDRIHKKIMQVPAGLTIEAYTYERGTFGRNRIPISTTSKYYDGVYTVKVPDDDERAEIYFRFKTTKDNNRGWVYSANENTVPKIVYRNGPEIKQMSAADRMKYYDLPRDWSSENYLTRYRTGANELRDGLFKDVLENSLNLKPFGANTTKPDKPLTFSLDDIVLLAGNSQAISDRNAQTGILNPKGKKKNLSRRSRVRILYTDKVKKCLRIFEVSRTNDKAQRHASSLIRFHEDSQGNTKNLIKYHPGGTRAVVFCGEFYDVSWKRTRKNDSGFKLSRGQILGARAAVRSDKSVHYHKKIKSTELIKVLQAPGIGDYDLHYLHGGELEDNKLCSYLVIYGSSFVMKDTHPTNGPPNTDTAAPSAADVSKFLDVGMINSMEHWNKKEYRFDQHGVAADQAKHIVRPFYMFEAYEEFSLTPPNPPIDFKTNIKRLIKHDNFKNALRDSRGGVPHSLVFIVEEDKGSWVRPVAISKISFGLVQFRIKCSEDDPTRFPDNLFPSAENFRVGEFGDPGGDDSYGCLVMAHELGHTTGQVDDYTHNFAKAFDNPIGGNRLVRLKVPNYWQFGFKTGDKSYKARADGRDFQNRAISSEAFSIKHDDKTMMDKNGPIRMRHVWRFAHWLSEMAQRKGSLEKFLAYGNPRVYPKFEINYPPGRGANISYFRTAGDKPDPWMFSESGTVNAAADRPMKLFLYRKLGETGRCDATDFKAILVARSLFGMKFDKNNQPTDWTILTIRDWTSRFNNWFTHTRDKLPGKFKLTSPDAGGLNPTLIRFLPGYDIYSNNNRLGHNNYCYRVTVKKNENSFNAAANVITMGDHDDNMQAFFFHIFDMPANSVDIDIAKLNFIRDWFRSISGDNGFTIEDV